MCFFRFLNHYNTSPTFLYSFFNGGILPETPQTFNIPWQYLHWITIIFPTLQMATYSRILFALDIQPFTFPPSFLRFETLWVLLVWSPFGRFKVISSSLAISNTNGRSISSGLDLLGLFNTVVGLAWWSECSLDAALETVGVACNNTFKQKH